MRISNIAPFMATKVSQINNNANDKSIKLNTNYHGNMASISNSTKNALQSQSSRGNFIDSLLKQKQNIIESKSNLIERATKNGQSLDSIKDQLENYEEQLNTIDKQIAEYTLKEQQKKIGIDKKENKISNNQPKTEEEAKDEHLNNIVALSSDISQIQASSSVKNKIHGQSKILAKEIQLDESRSLSGQKAVYKREQLRRIEERVSDIDKKIGETLTHIGEKIKDNTNSENNSIPKESEEMPTEQYFNISKYKDIQNNLNDPLEKSKLEILA